jgi:hypothetical protein
VVILVLAAAAALSIPRLTWQYFGVFTTLVHELGHAFAALLTGRRLTGIRIHRNHGGSAESLGRGGFSAVFSGFFGYPTPAMVGAALLWCVFNGYTATALLVGTVIIVGTLLFIRNAFGLLAVVLSAVVSGLLWYFAPADVQAYALLVIGCALLVGAVRAFFGVVAVHTRRRTALSTSDAYLLYRRTHVPSPVWLFLFAVVIAGSLAIAAEAYIATLS